MEIALYGPSNPWWLTFAIGIPLGVIVGYALTRM